MYNKSQHVIYIILVIRITELFILSESQEAPTENSGRGGPPPGRSRHKPVVPTSRLNGACRDGWVEGLVYDSADQPIPVCLTVNRDSLSWADARDVCRKDFGFLIKLESPVTIGVRDESLLKHLHDEGIDSIWTGIHQESDHLVWDELTPYQVRPLHNKLGPQDSSKRGWRWDTYVPGDPDRVCGEMSLLIDTQSEDHERKKRQTSEDADRFQPNTGDHGFDLMHDAMFSDFDTDSPDSSSSRNQPESTIPESGNENNELNNQHDKHIFSNSDPSEQLARHRSPPTENNDENDSSSNKIEDIDSDLSSKRQSPDDVSDKTDDSTNTKIFDDDINDKTRESNSDDQNDIPPDDDVGDKASESTGDNSSGRVSINRNLNILENVSPDSHDDTDSDSHIDPEKDSQSTSTNSEQLFRTDGSGMTRIQGNRELDDIPTMSDTPDMKREDEVEEIENINEEMEDISKPLDTEEEDKKVSQTGNLFGGSAGGTMGLVVPMSRLGMLNGLDTEDSDNDNMDETSLFDDTDSDDTSDYGDTNDNFRRVDEDDRSDDDLMKEAASEEEFRLKEQQELEAPPLADGVDDNSETFGDGGKPILEEMVAEEDQVSRVRKPKPTGTKMRKIKLSDCEESLPSVCSSYPITLAQKVSTCGDEWYGHVFVESCYKILPRQLFDRSRQQCEELGGKLADADVTFRNKIITRMLETDKQGEKHFWIDSLPESGKCLTISTKGVKRLPCLQHLKAICEKTALQPAINPADAIGQDIEGDTGTSSDNVAEEMEPKHIHFSLSKPGNTLSCDVSTEASELPTLWFKDGLLVDIKYRRMVGGVVPFPRGLGLPLSPLPEPASEDITVLELGSMLKETLEFTTNREIKPEMFQGIYWCEVWSIQPFQRIRSRSQFVRYTDVMTFTGQVNVTAITKHEELLFNMMNKLFDDIRGVETDLATIHSNISVELKASLPFLEDIVIFGRRAHSNPGYLEYFSFLKLHDHNYTEADEELAYTTLRRLLRAAITNTGYLLGLPGRTAPRILRTTTVRSTVACQRAHLVDEETEYVATFPKTKIGAISSSEELCDLEPVGEAECSGGYFAGAYWTAVDVQKTCSISPEFDDDIEDRDTILDEQKADERLTELAEIDVDDTNVDMVMDEVADVAELAEHLTADDISHIADIIEKSTNVDRMTEQVGNSLLRTVDRVMETDEEEVIKANQLDSAVNRIIRGIEDFAEKVELDENNRMRVIRPNLALDIWEINSATVPVIGLAAWAPPKSESTDKFNEGRIATLHNTSQLYGSDIDAAIILPAEVFEVAAKERHTPPRLYMMVYRAGKLFGAATDSTRGIQDSAGYADDRTLNSFVISASVGRRRISGLRNKIKTIFRPLKDSGSADLVCSFWDFKMNSNRGGWSSDGCTYNGSLNGKDVCLCDHLTNFAVLLDFYGQGEPIHTHHETSLKIITTIGLSLSILGLSLTIISYIFFKKLRQGRAQQTLFNLALGLLCSWLVFLAGIEQTHNYIGCIIVAVLLHYFILVSFMWMLMEAILQYLTFVKVLGTYITRFTLKTVLPAWGLPLLPVIVILSLDYTLYRGGDEYCWMSLSAFYYAFAIPIGVIIFANMTIFIITIVSIFSRPKGLRCNQSKQKIAVTNLQMAVTSFILLGLTWVFGYLAIADARILFHYIFTLLNSLQGFFIFILFVARKKKVRDQWLILCCRKPPSEKASRTLSGSSNSVPSIYSNDSRNLSGNARQDSTRSTTSFINHGYDTFFVPVPFKHA